MKTLVKTFILSIIIFSTVSCTEDVLEPTQNQDVTVGTDDEEDEKNGPGS